MVEGCDWSVVVVVTMDAAVDTWTGVEALTWSVLLVDDTFSPMSSSSMYSETVQHSKCLYTRNLYKTMFHKIY